VTSTGLSIRQRRGGVRIAIALPDLLGNIEASRGLQIPSRRTLSPYWKPRQARGFLSFVPPTLRERHHRGLARRLVAER
jgi:hypothetical protein